MKHRDITPELLMIQKTMMWLVVVLFVLFQLRILYFPFTHDALAWFYVNSRALQDDWNLRHFHPQCFSQSIIAIPLLLIPGRAIASFFHPETMMQAKLVSLAMMAVLITTLALIGRIAGGKNTKLMALAITISALSFGTLPYQLSNLRPETLMAIGIFLFMLLAVAAPRISSRAGKITLGCVYLLLASWLISMHPKGVLTAPLVLASGWFIFRSLPARTVMGLLVLAMTWQSYEAWKPYIACGDDYRISNVHRVWALPLDMLTSNPAESIRAITSNFSHFYQNYLLQHFSWSLYGNYFTPLKILLNAAIGCWIVLGVLALIYRSREQIMLRRFALLLACTVPGVLYVIAVKFGGKVYEASLVMPVIALGVLLAWAALRNVAKYKVLLHVGLSLLLLMSIAHQSVTMFGVNYRRIDNDIVKYDDQAIGKKSIDLYESLHDRSGDIARAAAKCGITLDDSNKFIIFDTSTYLAVQHTHYPIFGIPFLGIGPRGKRLMGYSKQLGSDGMIMHCETASELRLHWAIADGPYCCISKEMIDSSQ